MNEPDIIRPKISHQGRTEKIKTKDYGESKAQFIEPLPFNIMSSNQIFFNGPKGTRFYITPNYLYA